ncbi:hypothetical protein [Fibrella forsythiae]|uniref:Uncharacterized protein n=1 Tax=Fibrella forsythiae TaxID=2817061 RepID=A0ABS3JSG5_9BACT|nr:hypothetical protein [Fibrella forsythiae]MBO0952946.1 hypothetical protein [Fibrella forsythiae]
MKLTIKPTEIPFTVGATVWVNQACGELDQYPYFQATIIQIILDGSLTNSMVIRHPGNTHELVISNGIYDLKPVGAYSQLKRVTTTVDFLVSQTIIFQTEKELLAYTTGRV